VNDSFNETHVDWRITLQYNPPPVDAFDRANIYNPATGTLVPSELRACAQRLFRIETTLRRGLGWVGTLGDAGNTVIAPATDLLRSITAGSGRSLYFNAPTLISIFFPLPDCR
jgi:hypothetical protein